MWVFMNGVPTITQGSEGTLLWQPILGQFGDSWHTPPTIIALADHNAGGYFNSGDDPSMSGGNLVSFGAATLHGHKIL